MTDPLFNITDFPLPSQAWLRAYLHALDDHSPADAQLQANVAESLLRRYTDDLVREAVEDGPGVRSGEGDRTEPASQGEEELARQFAIGPFMRGDRPAFPDWSVDS